MRTFLITTSLLFICKIVYSQNLQSSLQDKIWVLAESYIDNERFIDTSFVLHIKFTNSGDLLSGPSPSDLGQSFGLFSLLPSNNDSYEIIESSSSSNPTIIIRSGDYEVDFNVAYYDEDDLVLINNSVSGETNTQHSIECRYILLE